jgi:hypothetical protein
MSIKSMAIAEVARDSGTPTDKTNTRPKPKSEALTDSIPTEVLAPYTTILAVVVANSDAGEWELGRWVIYAVATALVPIAVLVVWRRERDQGTKRNVPVAGMLGSTIAFGAWGIVMPGAPLSFTISDGGDLTIWTSIIVAGAPALIAGLPLTRQAS